MLFRKTLQQFTRQIIPFNVPFISNPTETLHYLEEIRQNEILNRGIAAETQCLTIINSIPVVKLKQFIKYCTKLYKEEVAAIDRHNNQWQIDGSTLPNVQQRSPPPAKDTWVNLKNFKKWVLVKYPPRATRYALLGMMYKITYNKMRSQVKCRVGWMKQCKWH